jgi:hypothetical protein
MPILGIGAVKLTAKYSYLSDATATTTWEDVLHAPTYICNAIGQPVFDGKKTISFSKNPDKGGIFADTGERVARIKPNHVLFAVDVFAPSDYEFGKSAFKPDGHYMVTCFWGAVELSIWQKYERRGHKVLDLDECRL